MVTTQPCAFLCCCIKQICVLKKNHLKHNLVWKVFKETLGEQNILKKHKEIAEMVGSDVQQMCRKNWI